MGGFINTFTKIHRNLSVRKKEEFSKTFEDTIEVITQSLGASAFRPSGALNAAVFDAVMVGVSVRLRKGPIVDFSGLKTAYYALLRDPTFVEAYTKSTADEENVSKRMLAAKKAFEKIK